MTPPDVSIVCLRNPFSRWRFRRLQLVGHTSKYSIYDILSVAIATELSWKKPYVGNAADALWHHIEEHHQNRDAEGGSVYAHYAAIVQSSGMGKSRTVDEMAKEHFVLPINVRDPKSQGANKISLILFW